MNEGFSINREEALQCMAAYYPAKYWIHYDDFTEQWRSHIVIKMNGQDLFYTTHPHRQRDGAQKAALRMYSDARTIAKKTEGKPPISFREIEERMSPTERADAQAKLDAGFELHVIGGATRESIRVVLDLSISPQRKID